MATNLRAIANIGLAGVLVALLASEAEAQQLNTYPIIGVSFRNGDSFAVEPGVVYLGAPAESGRVLAAMVRGQLAIGGCGGGLGLAMNLWPSPGPHDLRDLYVEGIVIFEARVERMYGPTSWRHATYAGPQLSVVLPIIPKVSVGWMIGVHDATDNHVQVGLGFGL